MWWTQYLHFIDTVRPNGLKVEPEGPELGWVSWGHDPSRQLRVLGALYAPPVRSAAEHDL